MAKPKQDPSANKPGADQPKGRKPGRPRKAEASQPQDVPLRADRALVVTRVESGGAEATSEHLEAGPVDWFARPDAMDEFVEAVIHGVGLVEFCGQRGFSLAKLFYWVDADPERKRKYSGARAIRADILVDESVSIADETAVVVTVPIFDTQGMPVFDANGGQATRSFVKPLDAEVIARNRLRFEARKWVASKHQPKTYGDKQVQEHTGPGGGPIVQVAVQAPDLKGLTLEELQTMELLLAKTVASEPAEPGDS